MKTKGSELFFAAYSYMGLDYVWDAPCWQVHVFYSAEDRDDWVTEHRYDGRQYVAQAITGKIASLIGEGKWWYPQEREEE